MTANVVSITVKLNDRTRGFGSIRRAMQRLANEDGPKLSAALGKTFQPFQQSIQRVRRDDGPGVIRTMNNMTRMAGTMAKAGSRAGGAFGRRGIGGRPGLAAAIGAVTLAILGGAPAISAFVPMLFGLGAAAGVTALGFKAIKKEAKELKPQLKELRKVAGEAMRPGLEKGFAALGKAMRNFKPLIRDVGKDLGSMFRELGEFANKPIFRDAFSKNVKMGMDFLKKLQSSLLVFTQELLNFGAKSRPALDMFSEGIGGLLEKGLPGFFDGLSQGIKGASEFMGGLFSMINQLLPALGQFIGAFADTLGPTLGAFFRFMGNQSQIAFSAMEAGLKLVKPLIKDFSFALKSATQIFEISFPIIKEFAKAIVNSLIPSLGKGVGPFQRLSRWIKNNQATIQEWARQAGNFIMTFVETAVTALPQVIRGFRFMATAVLAAFKVILDGATLLFGWVPNIGPKLRRAKDAFDVFSKGVVESLKDAEKGSKDFADEVVPRLRENKLRLNIENWKAQIKQAKKDLKNVPKEKRGKLKQDIKDWQRKLRKAEDQLHNMRAEKAGKLRMRIASWQKKIREAKANLASVPKSKQGKLRQDIKEWQRKINRAKEKLRTTNLNKTGKIRGDKLHFDRQVGAVRRKRMPTKTSRIRGNPSSFWGLVRRIAGSIVGTAFINLVGRVAGGFRFFAHGGVVGGGMASGGIARPMMGPMGRAQSGGPRGNTVMVGEQGPELVNLPAGSRVRSNPDTRRLLSQAGGSDRPIHITLNIGNQHLGELFIDPLRKSIATRGGDVQAVLGRA